MRISSAVSLALVAGGATRKPVSPPWVLFEIVSLPVVKTWVTSTVNREVAGSNPAACGESRQRSSGAERHTRSLVPRQSLMSAGAFARKSPVSYRLEKEYV
jgi:hypothetical protein